MTSPATVQSKLAVGNSTVTVPATLTSRAGDHRDVPLSAGLCLPSGQLFNVSTATITGRETHAAPHFALPAQADVLNRWPDGSVKWVLVSFVAPQVSLGQTLINVELSSEEDLCLAELPRITIKWHKGQLQFSSRSIQDETLLERTFSLAPSGADRHNRTVAFQLESMKSEHSGSERQTTRVLLRNAADKHVTLQLRLTHWVRSSTWQIESRLRNSRRARHRGGLWDLGDAGSYLFRSIQLQLRCGELPASAKLSWSPNGNDATRTTDEAVCIRQLGSGCPNWHSSNHVTASGEHLATTRGFEVTTNNGTLRGHQADPQIALESDEACLFVAVPEFWQNFPAELSVSNNEVSYSPFPILTDTQLHELQGGEQKSHSFWITTQSQPGLPSQPRPLTWITDPPAFAQSAESVACSQAINWFVPLDATTAAPSRIANVDRLSRYLQDATTSRFSLDERRRAIDEYGWRNFGDVPADHEQRHYDGWNTVVSHYNNQFDMIYGGILQWLSTGDPKWRDLFDPLARHVCDIDIYHTTEDRAAFNGGLFWHTDHYVDARSATHRTYSAANQKPGQSYGGGPSCEHNYTTGLLHYYFLTGHPEARNAVLSLADWVIAMDDGAGTIFGLLDSGATGAASATVFDDFHGPGRGAGNSINALLDAWLLTSDARYLCKLEELIRRCVHPHQNPTDLHLDDAEGHWSYTVFLTALGRYLLAKHDARQFDTMYSYARAVMQTYGAWMARYEGRTLEHPERLKYPTEAWAAQDFRKANVLRIAASCADDRELAGQMRQRADLINEAAWNDLAAFGDARLTARCLSIVMTEGHRELAHSASTSPLLPPGPAVENFGSWQMFVPQKARVRRMLKSPIALLKSLPRLLNVRRLREACSALRKQL